VTRYIIVEERTPADLQGSVQAACDKGYHPVGGVAVAPETEGFFSTKVEQTYMQAMVKEEK
jgi:hypothetical protein